MAMLIKLTQKIKRLTFIQYLAKLDRKISNSLEYKVRYSPKLASLFILYKYIVDALGFPIFGAIMLFSAPKGLIITISWIIMFTFNEFILKNIFKRSRPFMFDGDWSEKTQMFGYSFPSTHACNAGYLLVMWLSFHLPYSKILIPTFILLPISRIVLNYHFLGDVVSGFLLGVLWAKITIGII